MYSKSIMFQLSAAGSSKMRFSLPYIESLGVKNLNSHWSNKCLRDTGLFM